MNKIVETDKQVFQWLHTFVGKNQILDDFWKLTSVYLVYGIPIFLVINWFVNVKSREASLRATIIGAIGWLVLTPLISHLWYRERPFIDGGLGTKEIIFHRPTYSFPSDHALFAFAVASGFYFAGYKELGIGLYVVAGLIAFSRVVTGVHFPLDVIVGALIGIGLSWLAWHYRAYFDPMLVKPIILVAKWLHLG